MSNKSKPRYYGHRVKCLHCGTIIQSKHVHDYVTCKCKNAYKAISIDGGGEYCRMMVTQKSKWKVTKLGNYFIDRERNAK